LLSNDENAVRKFGPPSDTVVKPAAGGAYSQTLDTLLDTAPWRGGTAPIPAFIQPKLVYPEYRVYRIGPTFITLKIGSRQLDYRADRNASIAHVENGTIGAGLIERLTALSDGLGVDFAAFDLKTNAATSAVCLLELNTSPMIPAFDAACGGAIARAIVDYLLDSNGKPRPYPTARKAK
jgi:hypothetical protein